MGAATGRALYASRSTDREPPPPGAGEGSPRREERVSGATAAGDGTPCREERILGATIAGESSHAAGSADLLPPLPGSNLRGARTPTRSTAGEEPLRRQGGARTGRTLRLYADGDRGGEE